MNIQKEMQFLKTCETNDAKFHHNMWKPTDDMWNALHPQMTRGVGFESCAFHTLMVLIFSTKKEKMSKPVKQHGNTSKQKGRCDEMFVYMLEIYHVPFLMSTQHIYCIKCIIKNSIVFHAALLLSHIMCMHP